MAAESLLTDPLLSFASIAEAYDQLGHTLGWRFLTCPSRNLASPKLALISINPGGSDYEAPIWSVESGSAYVVESWKGSPPGQARLQLQVRQMFQVLDFDPAEALSGYLVPSFEGLDEPSQQRRFTSIRP